jgi:hypothetical protein
MEGFMNNTVSVSSPIPILDPRRALSPGGPVTRNPIDVHPDLLNQALREMAQRAAAANRPAAPERAIEFAHVGLNDLDKETWIKARLAVERMLDGVVDFLLGKKDGYDWAAAHTTFFKSIQAARRDDAPKPLPKGSVLTDPDHSAANERIRKAHAEEGQRLAQVLIKLLKITPTVPLDCGVYEFGQRRITSTPPTGVTA